MRRRPRCSNRDRKSTRLNSSHVRISYAVFCLKKKTRRSGLGVDTDIEETFRDLPATAGDNPKRRVYSPSTHVFFFMIPQPPRPTLFPYTTLFRPRCSN